MRRYKILCILLSLCLFMSTAAYGSFEKGKKAYSADDYPMAIREFLVDDSPGSLLRIGLMYYEGKGVRKDLPEAAKWFRRAAEKGDVKAKTNLGVMCLKGEGVELNKKNAFNWFSDAANNGFGVAQYYLGGMYYEGLGIRQDIIEAIKWFKKASDNGHKPANEALQELGQSVVWKRNDGDFLAILILIDESGKMFPNDEHIPGNIEPNNWLSMKANGTAIASLYCANCHTDSNNHCSETVDIAIFGPDWKLYKEVRNLRLYEDVFTEAKHLKKSGGISLKLEMEDNDMPGDYHIIVTVYDQEKPRLELSQFFSVSAKSK